MHTHAHAHYTHSLSHKYVHTYKTQTRTHQTLVLSHTYIYTYKTHTHTFIYTRPTQRTQYRLARERRTRSPKWGTLRHVESSLRRLTTYFHRRLHSQATLKFLSPLFKSIWRSGFCVLCATVFHHFLTKHFKEVLQTQPHEHTHTLL